MVIGVLQFELLIRGSESLKDKRRVVRSVKDRLHREHMVSVAEVARQDDLRTASMALACVGTDGARVGEVLDNVTNKLRGLLDAELGQAQRNIIHGTELEAQEEGDIDAEALGREMLDHFNGPDRPRAGP